MLEACMYTPAVKTCIHTRSPIYKCVADHKTRGKTMTPQKYLINAVSFFLTLTHASTHQDRQTLTR